MKLQYSKTVLILKKVSSKYTNIVILRKVFSSLIVSKLPYPLCVVLPLRFAQKLLFLKKLWVLLLPKHENCVDPFFPYNSFYITFKIEYIFNHKSKLEIGGKRGNRGLTNSMQEITLFLCPSSTHATFKSGPRGSWSDEKTNLKSDRNRRGELSALH